MPRERGKGRSSRWKRRGELTPDQAPVKHIKRRMCGTETFARGTGGDEQHQLGMALAFRTQQSTELGELEEARSSGNGVVGSKGCSQAYMEAEVTRAVRQAARVRFGSEPSIGHVMRPHGPRPSTPALVRLAHAEVASGAHDFDPLTQ